MTKETCGTLELKFDDVSISELGTIFIIQRILYFLTGEEFWNYKKCYDSNIFLYLWGGLESNSYVFLLLFIYERGQKLYAVRGEKFNFCKEIDKERERERERKR